MPRATGRPRLGKQLAHPAVPTGPSAGRDRKDRATPRGASPARSPSSYTTASARAPAPRPAHARAGLHADEILQQSIARLWRREPRAGRLFDIAAPSPRRSFRACIRRRARSPSIRSTSCAARRRVDRAVPPAAVWPSICSMSALVSPCAACRSDPLPDGRELVRPRLCSLLGAGQRTLVASARAPLAAARRPTADLLHPSPVVLAAIGTPASRAPSPSPRARRRPRPACLDTGDLGRDCPCARRGAGMRALARPRLAIDRGAERLLRPLPIERGGLNDPSASAARGWPGARPPPRARRCPGRPARAGAPPLSAPVPPPPAIPLTRSRANARRRASERAHRPAGGCSCFLADSARCRNGRNWRRNSVSTSARSRS
jgi:hypothetical protein